MTTLNIRLHPCFTAQMLALHASTLRRERPVAAQILVLLDLIRSHSAVRARLLKHFETIDYSTAEGTGRVDIKIIKALMDAADDQKYMTDAVRRIRSLSSSPVNDYRVFYAPRKSTGSAFECEILGVFHRKVAYNQETLRELRRRYEDPQK